LSAPLIVDSFRPVWSEVTWPFPMDQWGTGRAFACKAADCGAEVKLYLRAKLGSCNCATGVADDADLDRMSDFDLIAGEVSPLGAGRPITIAWMKGHSRAYTLTGGSRPSKSARRDGLDGADWWAATTDHEGLDLGLGHVWRVRPWRPVRCRAKSRTAARGSRVGWR
jgi:hypothetical protein